VGHRFTICHLFAALALFGLVVAPFVTPVAAIAVSMGTASAGVESASADLPEAMPCCPDEPAEPDCAKNCPFMAVCSGMALPTLAGGAALSMPLAIAVVIVPRSDAKLSGLAQGPPARPPKA